MKFPGQLIVYWNDPRWDQSTQFVLEKHDFSNRNDIQKNDPKGQLRCVTLFVSMTGWKIYFLKSVSNDMI